MHDAVMFEKSGVPATAIVTTAFRPVAESTARSMGLDVGLLTVIDHPVFTRDQAWIDALAARIAPEIVGKLALPDPESVQ